MSFDFPLSRKMHITRIFGTNKSGDILSDVWVDVLRIDQIKVKTQDILHIKLITKDPKVPPIPIEANQFQEVVIKLEWQDQDMQQREDDGGGNVTREHETLKVCAPDTDNFDDPDEWVPVPVIKRFNLTGGNVKTARRFLAKIVNSGREVEKRRFFHYDTSIDDAASAAAENGFVAYRVSVDDYQINEDTKDEDNYVEHEVVKKLKSQSTHHWLMSNGDDLKTIWNMKNQFLIDGSDEAKLEEEGSNGVNPPWRLDPFQNIINCSFGGLAVEFYDPTRDRTP